MKLFKGCEDGVHKYEARYTEVIETVAFQGNIKTSTHTGDVCSKCGKYLSRGESDD